MDVTKTDPSLGALLVGISNPASMPGLMDMAIGLQQVTGYEVVVSHVVTVRGQMALRSARTSPEVLEAQKLLRGALDYAAGSGVAARAVVEVGRDVDKGLINAARTHDAAVVLMGYSEEDGTASHPGSRRFERLTHRVSRGIDAHLLVTRFRGDHTPRSILVSVAEDSRLGLVGILIRALGIAPGAPTFRFLHVIHPDADPAGADSVHELLEEAGLAGLGTFEVVHSQDRTGALMVAASQHDLVILEASPDPSLVNDVFGSAAERIAERVPSSSILVREKP